MKKYFLILMTLVIAFAISTYAGNNIFIANTPRVNPFYLANLSNDFRKTSKSIAKVFTFPKINLFNGGNNVTTSSDNLAVAPTTIPKNLFSGNNNKTTDNNFAVVQPTLIPDNLFKYVSKGVSAYEKGDDLIFRIKEGAEYKVMKIEVDGKEYEFIDLRTKK